MHRRILSVFLFLVIFLGLFPAAAQGEYRFDRIWVQYATGRMTEDGQPEYADAFEGVDFIIADPFFLETGAIRIQAMPGFAADSVRVCALVEIDGALEMVPLVDAYGNTMISLSDGGYPSRLSLIINGMPYREFGVTYQPSQGAQPNGPGGYEDGGYNDGQGGEGLNWPPPGDPQAKDNTLGDNLFSTYSGAPPIDPDPGPSYQELPQYENPFCRVIDQFAELYDSNFLASNDWAPMDTAFFVNETASGDLIYAHDHQTGKLWISVTSLNGWSGYIAADAIVFMSRAEEETYRDAYREKPPKDRTSDYGRVTMANALLYTDVNGAVVTSLSYGETLVYDTSRPTKYDAGDNLWLPVRFHDHSQSGYIPYSTFTFMDAQGERDYIEAYEASKRPPEPTPLPEQPMPQRQTDFAYIKPSGTTLHNSGGVQIGVIAGNTAVEYLANAPNANFADAFGNRWVLVKLDTGGGAEGYIRVDSADFMTTREKESYDKEKAAANATPAPTAAPAETPAVTPEPTPQPEVTFNPGASRYGKIITMNNVNVRAAPDTGGDILTRVQIDDVVLVTQEVLGSNSTPYYRVEVSTKTGHYTGYVVKAYVRLMSPQEEANYIASLKPTPTPSPVPTSITQVAGFYRVSASYALMMPFEDIGASPLAALVFGEVVYVYRQVYDRSGNLFHNVYLSSTNQWGYILASSLTPMTTQELNNYFKTNPPTPGPVQTPSPDAFSGYAILTSGGVNFRGGPSTTSTSLKRLSQNTIVRVLDQVQNEGATWFKCESGGTTGYIRGDLLSLLNRAQYQSLMMSPSYDQNGNIITPVTTVKPGNISSNTWATPKPNQTITFVTIPPASTASPSPSPDPNVTPTPDPNATPTATLGISPTFGVLGDTSSSPDPDATLAPPGPSPSFPVQGTGGFSPPGLMLALVVLLVVTAGGLYGYSIYNKARRKQSQEQAKRLAEENRRRTAQQGDSAAKPAVRRPVPPTTPPGTQAKPGDPAKPGAQPQAGAHARPGTQGKPGDQGLPGANPYMRPPGQSPQQPRMQIQDITSPLARAQVDGKPVDGAGIKAPGSPPLPGRPPAAEGKPTDSKPQNPYARPPAPAVQRPIMPVAPPPVEPDNVDVDAPTPRRRRRQQEDGAGQDTGPKNET